MNSAVFRQAVFVVRQAGDEDMAYPERYAEVRDVARHRKDVRVVPSGEPAVLLRVDLLQIEDDEAGGLHQPVKIGQISRIVGAEGLTGGVQSRMHALGARQLEERRQELHLAQRFAAADRDAALLAPVVAVAPHPLEELVHRPFLAALSPGLRVVAVFAPQGAPLQKRRRSGRRGRPQNRKSPASGRIRWGYRAAWQVREMTSICCSRVRSMNLTA